MKFNDLNLWEYSQTFSVTELALLFGKSKGYVSKRLKKLKISARSKRIDWTEEERELLKRLVQIYPECPVQELVKYFPEKKIETLKRYTTKLRKDIQND